MYNYSSQYTDAGLYTCSSGGRKYKIPGSYGNEILFLVKIQSINPQWTWYKCSISFLTGHYEQDANTYASWGIECKLLIVYRYIYVRVHAFIRCKNGLVQHKDQWN